MTGQLQSCSGIQPGIIITYVLAGPQPRRIFNQRGGLKLWYLWHPHSKCTKHTALPLSALAIGRKGGSRLFSYLPTKVSTMGANPFVTFFATVIHWLAKEPGSSGIVQSWFRSLIIRKRTFELEMLRIKRKAVVNAKHSTNAPLEHPLFFHFLNQ